MPKVSLLKNVTILFTFLFLIWGCYRLIFKLPDEVEEIIIKPLIWIVPVLYLVKKEKTNLQSIGITFNNLFRSIYISLILGSFFAFLAFVTNYIKYGKFNFGANLGQEVLIVSFGLSFITAISEEIVFRGYIFSRLWTALNNEWKANILSTIAWTIIHIPVTIFVNKLDPLSTVIYLFLTFIYGFGSAYLYARTKNVASTIFLHVLWQFPIMLFR